MAESANQTAILRVLKRRGAWVVKIHQTGRGTRGTPDILCCYRGRFIALEVKSDRGKATDNQLVQLRAIQAAGGHALIVTGPHKVDQLLDAIDAMGDIAPPLFSEDAIAKPNVVVLFQPPVPA